MSSRKAVGSSGAEVSEVVGSSKAVGRSEAEGSG